MARATGRTPPELLGPDLPVGTETLVVAYRDFAGQDRVTLEGIAAWQQIMGVRLTPWESEMLIRLGVQARNAQRPG